MARDGSIAKLAPVSSFGGSPMRQEIGLANASRIEKVQVKWLGSEDVQTIDHLPLDSFVEITEGQDEIRLLPNRRMVFSKGSDN